MRVLWILAAKELRDGLRNRWVAATILLLGAFALSLAFLGSAPAGSVKASALDVSVVSLASLSTYLMPLIALMLSFDALVGEIERGSMLLLLTYPVARWQVVVGKFLGHTAILFLAIGLGYGGTALAIALTGEGEAQGWPAYLAMMGSSLLLGSIFVALGYLLSAVVRERTTAAGAAIGLWLVFVVLYDVALLGLLLADTDQTMGEEVLSALMLANPTDTYRIFNLTGFDSIAQAAGIAGIAARTGFSPVLLLGLLAVWVVLPLAATILVFQRREL